jgi:hypothetical protein
MFKSNAVVLHKNSPSMSLNRYEQAVYDYWETHPEEKRHWHTKVCEAARGETAEPGHAARELERELWAYLVERTQHVPQFRDLNTGGLRRISLLNLADYLMRLWGPPPKPKKPASPAS